MTLFLPYKRASDVVIPSKLCVWAGELNQGFKHILYSRLWTIIAEDIGVAAPFLALDLFPLYEQWTKVSATNPALARELTIRMVYVLSKVSKNRIVDNLFTVQLFSTQTY